MDFFSDSDKFYVMSFFTYLFSLSILHLAPIHNFLLLDDPFSFAHWSLHFIDFISYIHILLVNSLSVNPTLIAHVRRETRQTTDKRTVDHASRSVMRNRQLGDQTSRSRGDFPRWICSSGRPLYLAFLPPGLCRYHVLSVITFPSGEYFLHFSPVQNNLEGSDWVGGIPRSVLGSI